METSRSLPEGELENCMRTAKRTARTKRPRATSPAKPTPRRRRSERPPLDHKITVTLDKELRGKLDKAVETTSFSASPIIRCCIEAGLDAAVKRLSVLGK